MRGYVLGRERGRRSVLCCYCDSMTMWSVSLTVHAWQQDHWQAHEVHVTEHGDHLTKVTRASSSTRQRWRIVCLDQTRARVHGKDESHTE